MFQLEQALSDWKKACAQGEALSEDTADELEGHLRESLGKLVNDGLTEEEAFMVATHRVGKPSQLHHEFGKVHQSRVWLNRTILMLSGYLILSLLFKFVAVDQALLGFACHYFGLGTSHVTLAGDFTHHWGALLQVGSGLIGLGILIWLIASFSKGPGSRFLFMAQDHEKEFFGLFDQAPRSVVKLAICWLALYGVLTLVQGILKFYTVRRLSLSEYASYMRSLQTYDIVAQVATIVILVFFTAWLIRKATATKAA